MKGLHTSKCTLRGFSAKGQFFGRLKKQTYAICIGGSVSTSHDAFFTHLEAI